jgi:hypothetical protein
MFVPVPPVAVAPALESAPTLEAAFVLARAAVRPTARPEAVLAGAGPLAAKLSAIDALHSRIPYVPKAGQAAALDALIAAASSTAQPPEVRAKALAFVGYAMPQVQDDAARTRGLKTLLAALQSPVYRVYALRGLGPACHDLPKADEAALQDALLELLDGPLAGEERETALLALHSFIAVREDLDRRDPALVARFDARFLAPLEADPAGFVSDARGTPGARALALSCVWTSARERQALGNPAAAARVAALLDRLAAVERDATVLGWIRTYRTAAPPAPFRASTTRRAPAGPDEP